MNIETFLRIARPRDREDHCARYPHPALVLYAGAAKTTSVLAAASSELHFLVKTTRNAHANVITLGRSPSNDVHLDHPLVSKVHAAFLRTTSGWTVIDAGSTNGTVVNGFRLQAKAPSPLIDGAAIELGGRIAGRFFLPRGLFELLERTVKSGRH